MKKPLELPRLPRTQAKRQLNFYMKKPLELLQIDGESVFCMGPRKPCANPKKSVEALCDLFPSPHSFPTTAMCTPLTGPSSSASCLTLRACTMEATPWCCPSPSTSAHGTESTVQLHIYPPRVWPHDVSCCPFFHSLRFPISSSYPISLFPFSSLSLFSWRDRLLQRSL